MGSHAFGTSNKDSDYDFYGFIFAPIELTFPHTQGEILGFGRNIQRFEQVQYDHLPFRNTTTDITVYNIVKYFHLVMMGNPNMINSLFVPEECIIFQDKIANMVRHNRKIFLSQKSFHTFKGMMMAHLSRLKSNHTKEGRLDLERKYGYDVKDGYYSLRMMLELEQILYTGDLDLRLHSNILNQVRNGEIEKECLKIFYKVIIDWAKENNVEAFCTAWTFRLPEKYYNYKFSVERIALWNNKNSVVKKSSWMNKVSLDRNYNRDEKVEFRICKHKVTTDVNMLEPFASNFCRFMNDVIEYLNFDNDFSKYK